jgi:hypothetical protein
MAESISAWKNNVPNQSCQYAHGRRVTMKKRIRELERQLEDAELKVELNEKIIEIAEEQLNIQIRKKSDTK